MYLGDTMTPKQFCADRAGTLSTCLFISMGLYSFIGPINGEQFKIISKT